MTNDFIILEWHIVYFQAMLVVITVFIIQEHNGK